MIGAIDNSTSKRVYNVSRFFYYLWAPSPYNCKKTTIKKTQYTMYNQRCISMKTYDIHVNEKETKLQHFKHKTKKE